MESMRKKLLVISTILVAVLAAVSANTLIYGQPTIVGKVYTMDNGGGRKQCVAV
jgi:hypothetical protein